VLRVSAAAGWPMSAAAMAMGPFVVYDLLTVMDYGYPYELNILIDNQDQDQAASYEL
jgi:hypothetical protein